MNNRVMRKRGPKPLRKEVIWSPKLAYAIGLIATDGSLSVNGRHISLTSKDTEQLTNFMYCVDRKIRIAKKASSYTGELCPHVQFSDVTLYHFLMTIGLMPNKTKRMGSLRVPDEYFFDFLRGHHDGDGCFYSYFDPRWEQSFMFYLTFISASKVHIEWLQQTLERLCGVQGHSTYTGREGHKIWNIRYAKRETLIILRKMYSTRDVVCLSRKRLKIEKALRIVGKSLFKDTLTE